VDMHAIRRREYQEIVNLIPIEGFEVALSAVTLRSVFGAESVAEQFFASWATDMTRSEVLRACLTGIPPIRSFLNVGTGFADLLRKPLDEYRKAGEGSGVFSRVVTRGVVRGMQSFFKHLSVESLELADRMFSGVASVLLRIDGSLHPEPPTARREDEPYRDWTLVHRGAQEFADPNGARAGLQCAFDTLERHVHSAVQRGGRQGVPAALLQPAVGISEAASYTLRGIRSQLDTQTPQSKYKPPGEM